jgi:hypothetical protein
MILLKAHITQNHFHHPQKHFNQKAFLFSCTNCQQTHLSVVVTMTMTTMQKCWMVVDDAAVGKVVVTAARNVVEAAARNVVEVAAGKVVDAAAAAGYHRNRENRRLFMRLRKRQQTRRLQKRLAAM